jgi:hypothetical protein
VRRPPANSFYLVGAIRTDEPSPITTRIRGVVRDLSSQLAVGWVRTLREQMDAALVTERLLVSSASPRGIR